MLLKNKSAPRIFLADVSTQGPIKRLERLSQILSRTDGFLLVSKRNIVVVIVGCRWRCVGAGWSGGSSAAWGRGFSAFVITTGT